MNTLFPIFLKPERVHFLLIGGGKVAAEKLHFLLKSSPDAKVDVVALNYDSDVLELVRDKPHVRTYRRGFSVEDLIGKQLVIAATNNATLNDYLRELATKYGFLLNVADKPDLCDFYLGGIVTKGNLKLAISTNGKSPVLAKRMRESLEEIIPDDIDTAIEKLYALRKSLRGDFETKAKYLLEITRNFNESAESTE